MYALHDAGWKQLWNICGQVYRGSAAPDVVTVLAKLGEDYGVPVTFTTDGGPQYTAEVVRKLWYSPQAVFLCQSTCKY